MDEEKLEPTMEDLKLKLEEYQKQKDEYLAGWQRAKADFLNYKKEEMERIEGFLKYATEGMVLKILPVLDNFNLAIKNLPPNLMEDSSVKGILQIQIQIMEFLKNQGVEDIEVIGKKFDPNFHEVAELVDSKDQESGVITEEIQKGYKINGRLLRPAKVKIIK